jgi:hypothetical protein
MTDHQPEREGAGCFGIAVLLVIGTILLLPGLCVITLSIFNPPVGGGDRRALFSFIAVGALGALLIALAIRLIRKRG